jgi:hypothetical protein
MNDFVSFLSNRGIADVEELTQFVHRFLNDPSIFFELEQFQREEIESKMDEALNILNIGMD